jgi:hypothetical protein
MADLDPSHHIFRYVGGGSIEGDFIDPAAFRRKTKDGKLEKGLSVIAPHRAVFLLHRRFPATHFD